MGREARVIKLRDVGGFFGAWTFSRDSAHIAVVYSASNLPGKVALFQANLRTGETSISQLEAPGLMHGLIDAGKGGVIIGIHETGLAIVRPDLKVDVYKAFKGARIVRWSVDEREVYAAKNDIALLRIDATVGALLESVSIKGLPKGSLIVKIIATPDHVWVCGGTDLLKDKGGSGFVLCFDGKTLKELKRLKFSTPVEDLALEGDLLLIGKPLVELIRASDLKTLAKRPFKYEGFAGIKVGFVQGGIVLGPPVGKPELLTRDMSKRLGHIEGPKGTEVFDVQVSPDGRWVAGFPKAGKLSLVAGSVLPSK